MPRRNHTKMGILKYTHTCVFTIVLHAPSCFPGFVKLGIILINLDRSPDRLRAMAAQLDATGLPWERLAATDGRALDAEPLSRAYSPELNRKQNNRDLAPGQIACFTSHRRAWRRIAESGWDGGIVLEDDVVLAEFFPEAVHALASAPGCWNALKLHGSRSRPVVRRARLDNGPRWTLGDYRKIPIWSGAQALTASAAAQLFFATRTFGRPVDVAEQWWWETGVRFQALEPYPIAPAAAASMTDRGKGERRRFARLKQQLIYNMTIYPLNFALFGWRGIFGRANEQA